MNYVKALTYAFEDNFKKWFLPALCSLIPVIGGFILHGWALKVIAKIKDGEDTSIPELEFGTDLKNGFFVAVITLIYALPLVLAYIAFYAVYFVGLAGTIGLGGVLSSNGNEGFLAGAGIGAIVVMCLVCCFVAFVILYALAFAVFIPAMQANFVANDYKFGAGFQFKAIFALLKASFGSWMLVFVGNILLSVLVYVLIGPGALMILVPAYISMASSVLIGQAYVQSITPKVGSVEVVAE